MPVLIELPPPSDLVVDDDHGRRRSGETGAVGDGQLHRAQRRRRSRRRARGPTPSTCRPTRSGISATSCSARSTAPAASPRTAPTRSQLTVALPAGQGGRLPHHRAHRHLQRGLRGRRRAQQRTASANALTLTVPALQLGVPVTISLGSGSAAPVPVTVGRGRDAERRARRRRRPVGERALRALRRRAERRSRSTSARQQVLSADPSTLVPSTQAGVYYILIRGRSGTRHQRSVKLTAKVLPFSITDVVQDQGGDSRWVTVTISGARFQPGARRQARASRDLPRSSPARSRSIDATKIIATFDLRNAPHGLYDVAVINPDGEIAVLPYRYLIEDALPIDVTIGLGGPRVVPGGQTGLYSISLQSLTNVDTPYVYFTFGAPRAGREPEGLRPAVRLVQLQRPRRARRARTRRPVGEPGQRGQHRRPDARARLRVRRQRRRLRRDELHRHRLPGPEGDPRPRLRGLPPRDLRRASRSWPSRARSTRA